MSSDETVVLVLSLVLATTGWARWAWLMLRLRRAARRTTGPTLVVLAPVLCFVVLWVTLRAWAAHDVRDSPRYLLFYMALGAAWLVLGQGCMGWLGISARDDVAERANPAAACAIAGALLGWMLCYVGGNLGDGPGWWVVLFCSLLSTLGLLAVWLLVETLTSVSEAVTVDRDVASGIRLGALLCGCGLILGRAVAGDWVSLRSTLHDYGMAGWFAVVLALVEVAIGRLSRPDAEQPRPPVLAMGVLPALLYGGAATAWVVTRGPW